MRRSSGRFPEKVREPNANAPELVAALICAISRNRSAMGKRTCPHLPLKRHRTPRAWAAARRARETTPTSTESATAPTAAPAI